MKRLSEVQVQEKANLEAQCVPLTEALQAAVKEFNTRMQEEWHKVYIASCDYNDFIDQANNFIVSIRNAQDEFAESKPESWQEPGDGSAHRAWADAWDLELEEFQVEQFDGMMEPDLQGLALFQDLPKEP